MSDEPERRAKPDEWPLEAPASYWVGAPGETPEPGPSPGGPLAAEAGEARAYPFTLRIGRPIALGVPIPLGYLARLQAQRSNDLRARSFGRLSIEEYALRVLLIGALAIVTWAASVYMLMHDEPPPPNPSFQTGKRTTD